MTTTRPTHPPSASAPASGQRFRLPDIPERNPDEVTQFDSLFKNGNSHFLAFHLGNPETTLVEADRWIVPDASFDKRRARYPDLLVAFDVSPADYAASNSYIVSEQGKAPDFVLEVGSPSTASSDLGVKKDYYEGLGIGEYWLYDSEGEYYRFKLRGYRLVDGRYEEIEVEEIAPGEYQGYSAALELNLRATVDGRFGIYDPATGEHIPTFESERAARARETARADTAEARAESEATRADTAEAQAEAERETRLQAQARIRELERENLRLRQGRPQS